MHIPDGFLAPNVWGSAWIISIAGIGYCIRKTRKFLEDRMVPLMGVVSSFVFAAQMLNFPVIGGTSGHLLGGVLAAVLLGPYIAAIVLTCVLIVQCLIFQDGGLTSLGANIFNMAIAGTFTGYIFYRLLRIIFKREKGILISSAVGGWVSVVAASSLCALELTFSGTSPFHIVFPAMLGIHTIIGIGEGIITALVIGFVLKVRPDLVYKTENRSEYK